MDLLMSPSNSYVEFLTPSTSKLICIWGFYRETLVKMRSFRVGPNPIWLVF